MTTTPSDSQSPRWGCRVLLGLLMTLTVWTGTSPEARMREGAHVARGPLEAPMSVTVQEGSLSVNLQDVPVQEVIAMIGQQAGLRVRIDAAATQRVSAQFTAMALDQGLRRLLRGASLSYALLYTHGSAATASLEEVRVFGEPRREELAPEDYAAMKAAAPAADRLIPSLQERHAARQPAEPDEATTAEPAADEDVPADEDIPED
jgi:type II secretory pathway component GspD/PulD (secretin)